MSTVGVMIGLAIMCGMAIALAWIIADLTNRR